MTCLLSPGPAPPPVAFPRPAEIRRRPLGPLLVLAGLFTLLNAVKPLHMDDAAYYEYARHIAGHPLDPYGFDLFWDGQLRPAHQVLAPPLLPYWWAAALRLFGDRPFLWKLWLVPFALLLVLSLHALGRRFARGLELPLTVMAVLSPAVLPSFNLMLDVPALALSLGALAVFLRACDRDARGLAVLAGVLAGLAAQTKYTGLLTPAALLLYAVLFDRLRLGLVAAACFGLVFAGWEGVTAWLYGASHFLYHLHGHGEAVSENAAPLPALLMLLGGVAPAQLLLGLAALRVRRRFVLLAAGGLVLGYLTLAGGGDCSWWPRLDFVPFSPWETICLRFRRESLVLGGVGGLLGGCLLLTAWRLGRGGSPAGRPRRLSRFLVGWLALEVVGYVALTPFPAVRRVLGVVVASLLLVGRLAARTCRPSSRRRLVHGCAAAGVGLGLVFFAVDWLDARAAVRSVEELPRPGENRVWYVGDWGFRYYAERAGLRPVVQGACRLRAGDWLVVPRERANREYVRLDGGALERRADVEVSDAVPLRAGACYYGSRTPLEWHRRPRLTVAVYRVRADVAAVPLR
jgi:hypothetical protein